MRQLLFDSYSWSIGARPTRHGADATASGAFLQRKGGRLTETALEKSIDSYSAYLRLCDVLRDR